MAVKATLTPSQIKTLEWIKENGSVLSGVLSSGAGYSIRSAEALVRKGVLTDLYGPEQTVLYGKGTSHEHYETFRTHYIGLKGQATCDCMPEGDDVRVYTHSMSCPEHPENDG